MREAFINTLLKNAQTDPKIVLITGDLGFGVLDKFAESLPKQFINSGVNEQSMLGLAAGYASEGSTVFVYSIGNFPTLRALEQIRNDICAMNNCVNIVSVGAGYTYGPQGYTHHALEDIAVMRALPNINVLSPADPFETRQITNQICSPTGPSYLRLGKSGENSIHTSQFELVPNKFIQILNGTQGTLLFTGSVGVIVKNAALELKKMGINVGVYSCPYISHIDIDSLQEISGFGPIITVEEHSQRGGFGSAVLEAAANSGININLRMVAAGQENLSVIGDQDYLRELNGLSVKKIVETFNIMKLKR
jgi:transketolase